MSLHKNCWTGDVGGGHQLNEISLKPDFNETGAMWDGPAAWRTLPKTQSPKQNEFAEQC